MAGIPLPFRAAPPTDAERKRFSHIPIAVVSPGSGRPTDSPPAPPHDESTALSQGSGDYTACSPPAPRTPAVASPKHLAVQRPGLARCSGTEGDGHAATQQARATPSAASSAVSAAACAPGAVLERENVEPNALELSGTQRRGTDAQASPRAAAASTAVCSKSAAAATYQHERQGRSSSPAAVPTAVMDSALILQKSSSSCGEGRRGAAGTRSAGAGIVNVVGCPEVRLCSCARGCSRCHGGALVAFALPCFADAVPTGGAAGVPDRYAAVVDGA